MYMKKLCKETSTIFKANKGGGKAPPSFYVVYQKKV